MRVFSSADHRGHHAVELDGGELIDSWERPERVEIVLGALGEEHEMCLPEPLEWATIEKIHSPDYLTFLRTAWQRWRGDQEPGRGAMGMCWPARRLDQTTVPTSFRGQLGYYSFAADCSIVEGTWRAATAAVAVAQSATAAVLNGDRAAFALCRPPGHHASADQFGGYCYLNNAAVAAQMFIDAGRSRVAVLDVDYHHGNGTQDIFYERSDVLYCSIHADPVDDFPYFLGHAREVGVGAGSGFNLNEPLPAGTRFDVWSQALERCLRRIAETSCEALVVSLGLDTYEADPISRFALSEHDFVSLGRRLAAAQLPTVFVFEGGYAVEQLGRNVAAVLRGFEAALGG